jgi:hypothetical protein
VDQQGVSGSGSPPLIVNGAQYPYYTTVTKQQSKQWLEKGKPGPIKDKVITTKKKQMILAVLDSLGVIHINEGLWSKPSTSLMPPPPRFLFFSFICLLTFLGVK